MSDHPGPVDSAGALTPDWLTAALRAGGATVTVEAVRSEPIGHGQMGSNLRLHLTYAEGTGPATLVAKMGAGEDRSLVAGGYRKEVAFYRDFAATVAVRTPRCWHAAMTDDGRVFTLLFEDLAPAEVGDQLAGCSAAEAEAAVRNLAGLHGPRWCDETLWDHPEMEPVEAEGARMLGDMFAGAVAIFLERYRPDLDDDAPALLHRVAEAMPVWIQAEPERFALLHGDYRLDNLLFDGPAVTAVDWQTLTVGHPGRDLAYFVETSLTEEVRVTHADALVAAYGEGLADHGVTEGHERLWTDLRLGLLQGPMITVFGAVYASGERTERAHEMFLTMARRSLAAIRDLDPLALL